MFIQNFKINHLVTEESKNVKGPWRNLKSSPLKQDEYIRLKWSQHEEQ